MKWLTVGVLAVMLCLPLFVVFSADDMYNGTQDTICKNSPGFTKACQPYENRYDRSGVVSTAFYRHIAAIIGRTTETQPAFVEALRQDAITNPKLMPMLERAEQKLSTFTRNFAIVLAIATALAGAALLYSIQRIQRLVSSLRTQPANIVKKQPAKPKVTRTIKSVTPASQTTKRARRVVKPKSLKNGLSARSTKAASKPKRPETIRPRATR